MKPSFLRLRLRERLGLVGLQAHGSQQHLGFARVLRHSGLGHSRIALQCAMFDTVCPRFGRARRCWPNESEPLRPLRRQTRQSKLYPLLRYRLRKYKKPGEYGRRRSIGLQPHDSGYHLVRLSAPNAIGESNASTDAAVHSAALRSARSRPMKASSINGVGEGLEVGKVIPRVYRARQSANRFHALPRGLCFAVPLGSTAAK